MADNAAVVDKRDKTLVAIGGSDLLQVYLDAEEYETGSAAGWYNIGYLAGGTVGPERESEEIRSEAGVLIVERVTTNNYVFANASLQTDAKTLALLEYLEENAKKWRYKLPNRHATNKYQIHALYSGLVAKDNWTLGTGEGETRQRDFRVVGSADDDGNIKVIADVTDIDAAAEAGWPAELAPFLTDPMGWP